jgi:hypothetical protein
MLFVSIPAGAEFEIEHQGEKMMLKIIHYEKHPGRPGHQCGSFKRLGFDGPLSFKITALKNGNSKEGE